jgi:hypothetical protein
METRHRDGAPIAAIMPEKAWEERMTTKQVDVCLTFDFDAVSVWLGTFKAKSPSAVSRGEFGAVAVPRILDLLRQFDAPSTWYTPGHTADTYPDLVRRVADGGHEIAHHGYCH